MNITPRSARRAVRKFRRGRLTAKEVIKKTFINDLALVDAKMAEEIWKEVVEPAPDFH